MFSPLASEKEAERRHVRPPRSSPAARAGGDFFGWPVKGLRAHSASTPFTRGIVIRIRGFLWWAQPLGHVTQVDADTSPCGRPASHRVDQHIVHGEELGYFGILPLPPLQPG